MNVILIKAMPFLIKARAFLRSLYAFNSVLIIMPIQAKTIEME